MFSQTLSGKIAVVTGGSKVSTPQNLHPVTRDSAIQRSKTMFRSPPAGNLASSLTSFSLLLLAFPDTGLEY